MKIVFYIFSIVLSINSYAQFSTMFNDTLRPFGDGAYSLDNVQKDDTFYYVTGIFAGTLTNNQQWPIVLKFNNYGVLLKKKLSIFSALTQG